MQRYFNKIPIPIKLGVTKITTFVPWLTFHFKNVSSIMKNNFVTGTDTMKRGATVQPNTASE